MIFLSGSLGFGHLIWIFFLVPLLKCVTVTFFNDSWLFSLKTKAKQVYYSQRIPQPHSLRILPSNLNLSGDPNVASNTGTCL